MSNKKKRLNVETMNLKFAYNFLSTRLHSTTAFQHQIYIFECAVNTFLLFLLKYLREQILDGCVMRS